MLGLGFSSSKPNATDLWSATKYLYLPGSSESYARVQSFSDFLNRISDTGSDDIADTLTVSFWVMPIWAMGASGTNQNVETASGTQNNVPLVVFGNTSTEKDRLRAVYMIDTGGGSDRNRIMIQAMDASGNQERDEAFLHDINHSITNLGSALSNTGVSSGWWHSGNKGNVNSKDFVHLCFVRSSGDWTIYWNSQALGGSLDFDSGTLGFDEGNVDEFWLGRSFVNQDYFQMGYRDIAYFNAALTLSQVQELYNSGDFFDVRTHSQAAKLGLYWPCNDVSELSGAGLKAKLDLLGEATFRTL